MRLYEINKLGFLLLNIRFLQIGQLANSVINVSTNIVKQKPINTKKSTSSELVNLPIRADTGNTQINNTNVKERILDIKIW